MTNKNKVMKVLCVDAAPRYTPIPELTEGHLYEGYYQSQYDFFIPAHNKGYDADRFIPLSDIDEKEMIRELKEEKVYGP